MRRLTIGALSLGLFLAFSGCAVLHGRPEPAEPAPPGLIDPNNPDLEIAVLYVGDQEAGHIPVTIQFTEQGDFLFTFVFDGVGRKVYRFRNSKNDALVTIDMISGEPAAIDESTGVWTGLEFVSAEWLQAAEAAPEAQAPIPTAEESIPAAEEPAFWSPPGPDPGPEPAPEPEPATESSPLPDPFTFR